MENYFLIKIKECELQIDTSDKLYHIAMEKREYDLARQYSEEITFYLKRKLEYIDKLENLKNGI